MIWPLYHRLRRTPRRRVLDAAAWSLLGTLIAAALFIATIGVVYD